MPGTFKLSEQCLSFGGTPRRCTQLVEGDEKNKNEFYANLALIKEKMDESCSFETCIEFFGEFF